MPGSRVFSGINRPPRVSDLLPDRFEKNRELSDGLARLLAIERVRDVSRPCLSETTSVSNIRKRTDDFVVVKF